MSQSVNAYIVTAPALTARYADARSLIETVFGNTYNLRIVPITTHDEWSVANTQLISRTVGISTQYNAEAMASASVSLAASNPNSDDIMASPLTRGSIARSLNFLEALRKIAASNTSMDLDVFHMIMEDDVAIVSTPVIAATAMSVLMTSLPRSFDVVLLGGAPKAQPMDIQPVQIFGNGNGDASSYAPLETTVACIVSPNAARKLVDSFLPFAHHLNVHLAKLCQVLGLNAYMLPDAIFTDGSKIGNVLGVARQDSYRLPYVPAYIQLESAMANSATVNQANTYAQAAVASIGTPTPAHPHVLYLAARHALSMNDANLASVSFRHASNGYARLSKTLDNLPRFRKQALASLVPPPTMHW